ncbi:MAG: VWA domain-containing protein [Candidatus Heimdallarchaeota archaeon]|nr:VWA domain-containing protein [Candidatus Heimdallarchaeota archaeon]
MAELLDKLREYADLDEDEIFNFLKRTGLGSDDEEVIDDNHMDEELDDLEKDLIDAMEFVGASLKNLAPSLRKRAKELASELILKFIQGSFTGMHSLPTYKSRPLGNTNTIFDIDLERTIDDRMDNPLGDYRLWVYERDSYSHPVVLLLDTSYSMSGLKLIMAGLTVGILAQLVPVRDLAIVGFHKYTYFIKRFEDEISPHNLINRIMNIVPRGGTNLTNALIKGGELIFSDYHSAKLLMLSDSDVNMGNNPILAAAKVPKLDLLLFPHGNEWLARRLVSETRNGRLFKLRKLQDVNTTLREIFSL